MIVEVESYDAQTKTVYLLRSQKYVLPYFKSKGINVKVLEGHLAIRSNFASECSRSDVVYITGAGHGNYDCFTGHLKVALWKVGDYSSQEVEGKIIHLLSCRTCRDLGKDLIRNGAKAFFGYLENFQFYTEPNNIDPLQDKYTNTFIKCDSIIDREVVNCSSVKEIEERVWQEYTNEIYKWIPIDSEIAKALLWDREWFCGLGDPDTSLISNIFENDG